MSKILIIDDDNQICLLLSKLVKRLGHKYLIANSIKMALELSQSGDYDLILLDLELPDGNGLSILPILLKLQSSPDVLIITGTGDIQGAELAFKYGAWDFIPKPIDPDKVKLSITRALEYRSEKYSLKKPKLLSREGIVGESSSLKACLELVAQAAVTNASVLVTGETGTGKELVSKAIHKNSTRTKARFVVVDCASLPESLIESALFGHEKGSFTGAGSSHVGMIKQADHGTLFLDEVGELPLPVQKTFLRVLQERRFRPVGGNTEILSDFRLVAATNRDLGGMVKVGTFRKDLMYRLQSLIIQLPSLKERQKDIINLVMHHLEQQCSSTGLALKGCSPDFIQILQSYDWPGNVRELLNVLDHTLAMAGDAPVLYPIHLPLQIRLPQVKGHLPNKNSTEPSSTKALLQMEELPPIRKYRDSVLENAEKDYLMELMRRTKGKIKNACKISGLSKSRLHTLLNKYHTPRFRKKNKK